MMLGLRYLLFWAIWLTYLVAGTLYATLTPPWQAPDEPAHYNYIRYLATETGFPELVNACYDQAYLNSPISGRVVNRYGLLRIPPAPRLLYTDNPLFYSK